MCVKINKNLNSIHKTNSKEEEAGFDKDVKSDAFVSCVIYQNSDTFFTLSVVLFIIVNT